MKHRMPDAELLRIQTDHPLKVGQPVRHYCTGQVYEVVCVGFLESTLEPCVTYRNVKSGLVFTRPSQEFLAVIPGENGGNSVRRFEPVEG